MLGTLSFFFFFTDLFSVMESVKYSHIEWTFSPPAAGERRYDLSTSLLARGVSMHLTFYWCASTLTASRWLGDRR